MKTDEVEDFVSCSWSRPMMSCNDRACESSSLLLLANCIRPHLTSIPEYRVYIKDTKVRKKYQHCTKGKVCYILNISIKLRVDKKRKKDYVVPYWGV